VPKSQRQSANSRGNFSVSRAKYLCQPLQQPDHLSLTAWSLTLCTKHLSISDPRAIKPTITIRNKNSNSGSRIECRALRQRPRLRKLYFLERSLAASSFWRSLEQMCLVPQVGVRKLDGEENVVQWHARSASHATRYMLQVEVNAELLQSTPPRGQASRLPVQHLVSVAMATC
jgi:hypothetical protein